MTPENEALQDVAKILSGLTSALQEAEARIVKLESRTSFLSALQCPPLGQELDWTYDYAPLIFESNFGNSTETPGDYIRTAGPACLAYGLEYLPAGSACQIRYTGELNLGVVELTVSDPSYVLLGGRRLNPNESLLITKEGEPGDGTFRLTGGF